MAETAIQLASAAKEIHNHIKDLLKSKEPTDKDVDFQRKNLRRQYLRLLLCYPYAKESHNAEGLLWMQTSYAWISSFKQKLGALDKAVQIRQGGHGLVEQRKLLQRFRQFLAEEDTFWTLLVVRICKHLPETYDALDILGIPHEEVELTGGREAHQFPHEDPTAPSMAPQTSEERTSRLTTVSKALVCLGDIARYKELYSEAGGRPKAGQEDNTGHAIKGPRKKRGQGPDGRPRNYERAKQCYEQARRIMPFDGNASHQLAILASYQKENFTSLWHYYRAICVKKDYETASDNLSNVLIKALEQWKGHRHDNLESSAAPRHQVFRLQSDIVALHALWRLDSSQMDEISPGHAQKLVTDLAHAIDDRLLLPDMILTIVVVSQGALYKHRVVRNRKGDSLSAAASLATEGRMFSFLLSVYQNFFDLGVAQLAEANSDDSTSSENGDLSQKITAKFRRTLPAMRVASKWIRANFKYTLGGDVILAKAGHSSNQSMARFWATYADFATALHRSFPKDALPVCATPLEEDVEMKGFLPLKKLMDWPGGGHQADAHPNEEMLTRVSDLLDDATLMVNFEDSPLYFSGGLFYTTPGRRNSTRRDTTIPPPTNVDERLMNAIRDERMTLGRVGQVEEDTMTEATSHDDPVGDAFRKVIDGSDHGTNYENEEDEDDEAIVWDPRPRTVINPTANIMTSLPPPLPSPPRAGPPSKPVALPAHSPFTVTTPLMAPKAPLMTTAADLLNNVMGTSSSRPGQQSIWSSTVGDMNPLRGPAATSTGQQYPLPLTEPPSQAWSSQPKSRQSSQAYYPNTPTSGMRPHGMGSSQGVPLAHNVPQHYHVPSQQAYRPSPGFASQDQHLQMQMSQGPIQRGPPVYNNNPQVNMGLTMQNQRSFPHDPYQGFPKPPSFSPQMQWGRTG